MRITGNTNEESLKYFTADTGVPASNADLTEIEAGQEYTISSGEFTGYLLIVNLGTTRLKAELEVQESKMLGVTVLLLLIMFM